MRADRLGPALLLVLLAASLAVTAYVFRARTPDLALELIGRVGTVTPDGNGTDDVVDLRFFVRFDEPEAFIGIIGRNRVPIRTLAEDFTLEEDRQIVCTWDARDDEGELVERGRYRLRVVLPGQDRDMVFPRRIDVQDRDEDRAKQVDPNCSPVNPEEGA